MGTKFAALPAADSARGPLWEPSRDITYSQNKRKKRHSSFYRPRSLRKQTPSHTHTPKRKPPRTRSARQSERPLQLEDEEKLPAETSEERSRVTDATEKTPPNGSTGSPACRGTALPEKLHVSLPSQLSPTSVGTIGGPRIQCLYEGVKPRALTTSSG